jgi:hypothetical protein
LGPLTNDHRLRALVAVVIIEHISAEAGLKLLPFLVAIAAGSVLQWYRDELHGHGDLRAYAAVQLYSALVLLIAPLLKSRYSRGYDFLIVFAGMRWPRFSKPPTDSSSFIHTLLADTL